MVINLLYKSSDQWSVMLFLSNRQGWRPPELSRKSILPEKDQLKAVR